MLNHDQITSGLLACELFQGLNEHQLTQIQQKGDVVFYHATDTIIEEGQTNQQLHAVIAGEVEIFLPQSPQRPSEIQLTRLSAGECIGEFSFIDRAPASASVTAIQDSAIFQISKPKLESIMDQTPQVGKAIYNNLLLILVKKLRVNNEELDIFRSV